MREYSIMLQSTENQYHLRYLTWIHIIQKYLDHYRISPTKALDIGCGRGEFKDLLGKKLKIDILGIEPNKEWINEKRFIFWGYCHKTPFKDNEFDLITLISVFEHVPPRLRKKSIEEIKRILKPDGLLFIQMPNPKFPLEFHTRLPFVGFLPRKIQYKYVRLIRRRGMGFWSINIQDCLRYTEEAGFEVQQLENYRYSNSVLPTSVRRLHFITRLSPMGSYAILRIKQHQ